MRAVIIEAKGEAPHLVEDAEESMLERTGATVEIDVMFSGLNYKDGMALAGRGIARTYPLIPGIDLVGRVTDSADPYVSAGDLVVLNGDGIGESAHGGYADRAHVRPEALIRLPEQISPERAAAIGTAGFTAMLAVLRLEDAGLTPGEGDVLVTGATGGVGAIATMLLAGRGHRVVAATGRAEEHGAWLQSLGAAELLDREELCGEPGRPLQSQRWAGAVDTLGSTALANTLASTCYGGTVAACGLAQGADLPTTVMPFILRGVTLAGINSVEAPAALRRRAWDALAVELDLDALDAMTRTIPLEGVFDAAEEILAGRLHGRTVVAVAP